MTDKVHGIERIDAAGLIYIAEAGEKGTIEKRVETYQYLSGIK